MNDTMRNNRGPLHVTDHHIETKHKHLKYHQPLNDCKKEVIKKHVRLQLSSPGSTIVRFTKYKH